MIKHAATALAKMGLLTMITVLSVIVIAQGQSFSFHVRADIPFDFTVGGQKLPAGKYSITSPNRSSGDITLLISSDDGQRQALRLTLPVTTLTAKDKGTLVFERFGDQYFLSQVWLAGSTSGREFFKSKVERDLEQQAKEVGGTSTPGTQKSEIVNVTVLP